MAAFRSGVVEEVLAHSPDLIRLRVRVAGSSMEAFAFPAMIPPLEAGHRVVVNTTGIELGLGTGGVAFVLWNLDSSEAVEAGRGHIVKMRYTPWQSEVVAAEAPEGRHHAAVRDATSLHGMPVVTCGLHSQVAGIAAGLRAAAPRARIGYLMTDGGALPLAWSRLVGNLRDAGLIDVTCTAGHAFGGDIEAVNVFSGLLALRHGEGADAVVVALGPGVVGTGTRFGNTALEQGQLLDAAGALDGRSVAALRISFADPRPRHAGLSHHTATALATVARDRTLVALPRLDVPRLEALMTQLDEAGITAKHDVTVEEPGPGLGLLEELGLRPSSMGRPFEEVPELFAAGAAAGAAAAASIASGV